MNESCRISEKLIAIIQENGPEYPEREPFQVYLALMKDHVTNHKIAGAVLNVFLSEIISHMERYGNVPELSEAIQEKCGFCQEVSSTMAETLLQVYSEENMKAWECRRREGLKRLMKRAFSCEWKGFSLWHADSVSVRCYYQAQIVLKPAKDVAENEVIKHSLHENPFVAEETIERQVAEALTDYLDEIFDDYCTCDPDYPPAVEDFDIDDYIEAWCENNHFEFQSSTGHGYDCGYEADF